MLMLSLDDAVKVAKRLIEDGMDDDEIIRQELEQKCWLPPKTDGAAKRLNDLIFDVNPTEIRSQIEADNLKNWCKIIQTEMKMAMVQLPCWGEKEMDDYEELEELDFVQPHKKIPVNLVVDNWIPCSKKVPEEKGMYLTTTIDKGVYCDFWNGVNFDRTELVIAWRSLPEPYKEDDYDHT